MRAVQHVHTADIDPEATKAGGDVWEGFVNVCVTGATEALEAPPNGYLAPRTAAAGLEPARGEPTATRGVNWRQPEYRE